MTSPATFYGSIKDDIEKITPGSLLGKPMSQCDLEKKRIYDLLQIIAYHARERLVQEFRREYKCPHDVKQIIANFVDL
jgi:hypothetical protein